MKEDTVNIIVHGHEPSLSEIIVQAVQDPEMIAYARSKGATGGISLGGICCTSNEILMRHGIPIAGNYLQQEMAIITGALEDDGCGRPVYHAGCCRIGQSVSIPRSSPRVPLPRCRGRTSIMLTMSATVWKRRRPLFGKPSTTSRTVTRTRSQYPRNSKTWL